MQEQFLALLAVGIMNVASQNYMITADEQQIALCVETIAHRYFTPGHPVLLSMPREEHVDGPRSLPYFPPRKNNMELASFTLYKLHENTMWPLRLVPPEITMDSEADVIQGYVIFTWPEEEDTDALDSIRAQVDSLREMEGAAWNSRGRFVVVVTEHGGDSPRELALKIYAEMWKEHYIIDNIVLVASRDTHLPKNDANFTDAMKIPALDLYTGFPYQNGRCGEVTEVVLLDQWQFDEYGGFCYQANLFPQKIPSTFGGCPIKVASLGTPPQVILTENSTQDDVYKIRGLAGEYVLVAADKMNVTVDFLQPSLSLTVEDGLKEVARLAEGKSDVLIGTVPLLPVFVSWFSEPTIPYVYSDIKWYVPCPKPVLGTEKVMTTYEMPVWLMMGIVLIVTSVLWWRLATGRHNALKESNTFKTLPYSFYSAWAVSIGVSVPNLPNTWNLRIVFLVYVCYSFAMCTVFQAFFVSFLVDPRYEKKIETFEELLQSSVAYGHNDIFETGMMTTTYTDHLRFHSSRRVDCSDMKICMERFLTDRDICTISYPAYSKYLASEMGVHDVRQRICSLEENLITTGFVFLLRKGSPFLREMNKLVRLCFEGGLVDRYWTELIWLSNLRSKMDIAEDQNDMYFAFSTSHLSPAFWVLIFGYALSSLVFLAEIIRKCKLQHNEITV